MTRNMIKCREYNSATKKFTENYISSGDKLNSVDLRVTLTFDKPWDVAEQGDSSYDMLHAFAVAYVNNSYAVEDESVSMEAFERWVPLKKVKLILSGSTYESNEEDEQHYRNLCKEKERTPTNAGFKIYLLERQADCKAVYV